MEAHTLKGLGLPGLFVFPAALAAMVAVVVSPALLAGRPVFSLANSILMAGGLLSLAAGLATRRPFLVLAVPPTLWAMSAYFGAPATLSPAAGAVAVGAVAAFVVASLRALHRPQPAEVEWSLLEASEERAAPRDVMPLVAGLLVAMPAVGVLCWAEVPRAAAIGFPGHAGRVSVGLVLLGTLVGLALATDLTRGREPLRGSLKRATVLALVALAAAGAWLLR